MCVWGIGALPPASVPRTLQRCSQAAWTARGAAATHLPALTRARRQAKCCGSLTAHSGAFAATRPSPHLVGHVHRALTAWTATPTSLLGACRYTRLLPGFVSRQGCHVCVCVCVCVCVVLHIACMEMIVVYCICKCVSCACDFHIGYRAVDICLSRPRVKPCYVPSVMETASRGTTASRLLAGIRDISGRLPLQYRRSVQTLSNGYLGPVAAVCLAISMSVHT